MKKILLSLFTLGLVAAAGTYLTRAYFTDTEISANNTITSGTIDISVDGENPWTKTYSNSLSDMKPSYDRFVEFNVKNEGTNPLRLYKRINNIETADGNQSEPECTAGGGTWNKSTKSCGGSYTAKNDIDTAIEYDMYLGGEVVWDDTEHTQGHVDGGDVVIHEDDGIMLSDVENHYIYIGEIEPGDSKHIIQSYHMATDTGNWAQGDTLTFDIELLALQLNAPGPETTTVMLNNKTSAWDEVHGDGTWGMLSYTTSGPTFDYNFVAKGLNPSTAYALIYAPDPWPQGLPGGEVTEIGTASSDASGNLTMSGTPDLGYDIPHPDDDNFADGGKIWLVLDADHDGTKMIVWHQSEYLFEHNFVKYDDTDF